MEVSPGDGRLLALSGGDCNIKIFDRRELKIVRVLGNNIHSGNHILLEGEFIVVNRPNCLRKMELEWI